MRLLRLKLWGLETGLRWWASVPREGRPSAVLHSQDFQKSSREVVSGGLGVHPQRYGFRGDDALAIRRDHHVTTWRARHASPVVSPEACRGASSTSSSPHRALGSEGRKRVTPTSP